MGSDLVKVNFCVHNLESVSNTRAVFGFSNMVRNSGPTLGIIFWVLVRVMVYNVL